MAVPPRVLSSSSVSTLRIRFLALVIFSMLSCTFSKHCRKKSVNQRPPESKAEFRTPIVDFLPGNAGDAAKARSGRDSRDDEMAVPPRVLSSSYVLTLRIRFLALVVFSVLSCTFSEHCRKKSVDQRPPKSQAEFRMPIVVFLCVKVFRRVKKDRTLVKKKIRSSLSQRAAEHPMQWVKKKRTGLLNRHPFERKSSSIRAGGSGIKKKRGGWQRRIDAFCDV